MDKKSMSIQLPAVIWGLELAKKNGWHGFVDFKIPGNNEAETVVYHPSDIESQIEQIKQNYNPDGTCKTNNIRIVNSGAIQRFESYKRCVLNRLGENH